MKIIKKKVKLSRALRDAHTVYTTDKDIVVKNLHDFYDKRGLAVRIGVMRFFKKTPKNLLYSEHFS
jgi:hypothetical protein